MVSSRSGERGEGGAGCLLSLVGLILAGALGFKLVPVYYANSTLAEYAGDVAGEAALFPVAVLEAKVRARAQDLGIAEAEEAGAVTITTRGGHTNGFCTVVLDYSRTVDLYGAYPLTITTRKVIIRPYMDSR